MRFVPLEIIPTCTGNTQSGRLTSKFKWDHPRTCGEHSTVTISPLLSVGSSPHVRGAHTITVRDRGTRGIIPACTGSTTSIAAPSPLTRDHPRMCGEHVLELRQSCPTVGSSPHVRGARLLSKVMPSITGIIPACAGSTCTVFVYGRSYWDHPRMCGEHAPSCSPYPKTAGSSPHVRGAPSASRCGFHVPGIIPACAGSTMAYRPSSPPTRDNPRMCGEHMPVRMTVKPFEGSSPHVRGALSGRCGRCRPIGIIPACAGSTPTSKPIACNERDHPRMCGEHQFRCNAVTSDSGSSPACAGSTSSSAATRTSTGDHPRMCGEHRSCR